MKKREEFLITIAERGVYPLPSIDDFHEQFCPLRGQCFEPRGANKSTLFPGSQIKLLIIIRRKITENQEGKFTLY